MENFGLHDKIEIEGREFHIHTGTLVEHQKLISEIFEKGMFLTWKEYSIQLRSEIHKVNYEYLNDVTQEFHNAVIEELEALYRVEEKLGKFKHPTSRYHLGILFLKRNLYPEAIRQFEFAISDDPNFLDAYIGLGISHLKARQFRDALEIFKSASELKHNYPDLLNYSGMAHLFMGDFDRATTLFKDAISLNTNYFECQFNLGVALYKSALDGVKDPKAVAVPARVVIYLKQVRDLDKYQSTYWQRQFNQLVELLKTNNHEVILPEIEKFQLRLVDYSSDKDKVFEFFLRFLFGGDDLTPGTIEKYEHFFRSRGKNGESYPDYWNDMGIFNLIKSRSLYLKALAEFEKAIEIAPNFNEAVTYRDLIKSNERGFLILLRAILK